MIQIYADGALIYDSRLLEYELTALTLTSGLNKGGTAEFTMPSGHPAYNALTSYRTVVEVYRDKRLKFRGRVLYPSDRFDLQRTIVCEGERCFFRDSVIRPYLYQDEPEVIFADLVAKHNAQVEPFKRFVVGEITVTDPNDYIRLENEEAENTSAVLDKLVERCGGVVVFTTNEDGERVINWYARLNYRSRQLIEFGENLIDFKRSANTDLATRIVPYGAKNETTGERITIESVNDGVDYVQDDEAVALRGVITQVMTWDDVTEPANLLTKARQQLATSKNIVTSLELTAFDLSLVDKTADSFLVGDYIRVRSKPHGIDDDYQLQEQTLDLLHPANDRVVLGKSVASLIGADVAGDRKNSTQLKKVETVVAKEQSNTAAMLEELRVQMTSLIQQTSDSILLQVSETYATDDEVTSAVSTSMTQLSDSFEFMFAELQTTVNTNDAEARAEFEEIRKYIRFEDGNIVLGESGNEITLRIENDRISFLQSGAEVAYFSQRKLYVVDGEFLGRLKLGKYAFEPQEDGSLTFGLIE